MSNNQNNEKRKRLDNILREPLTRQRLTLQAHVRAAKQQGPNAKPFTLDDFKKFVADIPGTNTNKEFQQEVVNVMTALQDGEAPKKPNLTTPQMQLLWGGALSYLSVNPDVMQTWKTPVQTEELKTSKLWKQVAFSKPAVKELLGHAHNIREAVREKDMRHTWGLPGEGYVFDARKKLIRMDLTQSLISGFEHARADILRETGKVALARTYPQRMQEIAREMKPLRQKAQKAAQKKGPQLSRDEYKKLRLLGAEWTLRKMMYDAAQENTSNRYVRNLVDHRDDKLQDFSVSLNNAAVTARGMGLNRLPNDKSMSDDMKRYINLCWTVQLSSYQNNNFFDKSDSGWSNAGVNTNWVRKTKTLKDRDPDAKDDNQGVSHKDFQKLIEMCQGVDGLEHLQPKPHEHLYGKASVENRIKKTDEARRVLIEKIWNEYAEDMIQNILDQANDQIEQELDEKQQNEQDQDQQQDGDQGDQGDQGDSQDQDGDGQDQDGQSQDQQGQGQKGKPQKGQKGQKGQKSDSSEAGEPSDDADADDMDASDAQPSDDQDGQQQQQQKGQQQKGQKQDQDGDDSDAQGAEQGEDADGEDADGQEAQGAEGDEQDADAQDADGQEGDQSAEGQLGKDDDSTVPVEGMGDMPDVENAQEDPSQDPSQNADGQDADGDGQDADGQDSDGQDADGQDADGDDADGEGQTAEDLEKQLNEMEQAEKAEEADGQDADGDDADGEGQDADGKSQKSGKNSSSQSKPSEGAGEGGKKDLSQLAKQDWTNYPKRVAELQVPIQRVRKQLKAVQERQLQRRKVKSQELDIIPENGEVMERFNIEAHRNLVMKRTIGNVEAKDFNRFHKDEVQNTPTELDIVILIDGSGSMGSASSAQVTPLESALQAACILHEAASGKDMKMNVYVGMWGNADPPMIIKPGATQVEIGREMERARRGLNCGTDLAPAVEKVANVMSEKHGKTGTLSGFTHVLVISDGDINDAAKAKEKIDTMFECTDKVTMDTAVIKGNKGSAMENMAKGIQGRKTYQTVGVCHEVNANQIPLSIVGLLLDKIRKCGSFTAVPASKKRRDMKKASKQMGRKR